MHDRPDFNLAYIPPDFNHPHPDQFNVPYMRALFDVGYGMASKDSVRHKVPPDFQGYEQTGKQIRQLIGTDLAGEYRIAAAQSGLASCAGVVLLHEPFDRRLNPAIGLDLQPCANIQHQGPNFVDLRFCGFKGRYEFTGDYVDKTLLWSQYLRHQPYRQEIGTMAFTEPGFADRFQSDQRRKFSLDGILDAEGKQPLFHRLWNGRKIDFLSPGS